LIARFDWTQLAISENMAKKKSGVVSITYFAQSSLTGSFLIFINLKYSCTTVTSSVVTGDCISQNTWNFHRMTAFKRGKS